MTWTFLICVDVYWNFIENNLISLRQFIATFDKKSDKKVMFGPNKDSGDDSAVCAWCPILSPHTALSKIIKIISVSIQCLFGEDTICEGSPSSGEDMESDDNDRDSDDDNGGQRLSAHEDVIRPRQRILIRVEEYCVGVRILMMPPTPSPDSSDCSLIFSPITVRRENSN